MELSDLKPAAYNPRAISKEAMAGLTVSLKEFGDISGITWNKRTGNLVTGHQRLAALKAEHKATLKMSNNTIVTPGGDFIKVRVVDWPEDKERLANIAANSHLIEGAFTLEAVQMLDDLEDKFPELFSDLMMNELSDQLHVDFDLDGGADGLTDPDDVPEPPDDPITKPGDLWILGDHRLLCGDSSKQEDVDRLLDGTVIHLVNTDPPYNVKVEPRSNNAIAAGMSSFSAAKKTHHQGLDLARHPGKAQATHKKMRPKDRPLESDFVSEEEFDKLLHAWFGNASRVLMPGGAFYIWGGYANCGNYPPVLNECDLYFSQAVIWVKEHPVLTRKDFMGNHEWCFYGWKKGAAHRWLGPTNATDVWSVKKVNPQSMIHLTEKPVELAVLAMTYSSKPGENVLDLFGGSGSTLIGAERPGRKAFLMEIDMPYCDVIVQRWEKFTGKSAALHSP